MQAGALPQDRFDKEDATWPLTLRFDGGCNPDAAASTTLYFSMQNTEQRRADESPSVVFLVNLEACGSSCDTDHQVIAAPTAMLGWTCPPCVRLP
jgi:hypothetical protein